MELQNVNCIFRLSTLSRCSQHLNVWNVNHSKTKRPLYEYNVLRQLLVEFEGIRLVDLI